MRSPFLNCALLLLCAQLLYPADDPSRGERLYLLHCSGCHGPKGAGGRGANLAVPKLSRAPDEKALLNVIRQGIPGTEMPWSYLDENEARQVAAWVRKLGQVTPSKAAGKYITPRRNSICCQLEEEEANSVRPQYRARLV